MPPRDALTQPYEGYPAYGAVHGVVPSRELLNFLHDFSEKAFAVFDDTETPLQIETDNDHELDHITDYSDFDPRNHFKVFNAHTLSVTVLEMDPSASSAKRVQAVWEKQDFGAVEKEARNELDRKLPDSKLHAVFDQAIPVGGRLPNGGGADVRQKIALVPSVERSPEIFKLVDDEASICVSAVARRLKQFVYPWDIVPHMTFAVFKRKATPEKIGQMLKWVNAELKIAPIGTALDPLTFRHRSVRGRHP